MLTGREISERGGGGHLGLHGLLWHLGDRRLHHGHGIVRQLVLGGVPNGQPAGDHGRYLCQRTETVLRRQRERLLIELSPEHHIHQRDIPEHRLFADNPADASQRLSRKFATGMVLAEVTGAQASTTCLRAASTFVDAGVRRHDALACADETRSCDSRTRARSIGAL